MSKSWQEWVDENIGRNCDPEGIKQILLQNQFSTQDIQKMMGDRFPPDIAQNGASNGASAPSAVDAFIPLTGKRESLSAIQRELAGLSQKTRKVERRHDLTRAEFLEEYYAVNRPVILIGAMKNWKALEKWTPEYLKQVCGEEMVEISASRNSNPLYEMHDEPHRQTLKFSEFVDRVSKGGETNDYYLTARNNFFARPGAKSLLQDMEIFPEYLTPSDGDGMFFWYGPKGTITPLHHDAMNIFMAQVQGRKQVKLIPANDLDLVYNHFAVYSMIDPANPDYEKFPNFRQATVIDVDLAPGEVLFLPVGWWHYVKSLDVSMTVSFNNFVFLNEFKWAHPSGY